MNTPLSHAIVDSFEDIITHYELTVVEIQKYTSLAYAQYKEKFPPTRESITELSTSLVATDPRYFQDPKYKDFTDSLASTLFDFYVSIPYNLEELRAILSMAWFLFIIKEQEGICHE